MRRRWSVKAKKRAAIVALAAGAGIVLSGGHGAALAGAAASLRPFAAAGTWIASVTEGLVPVPDAASRIAELREQRDALAVDKAELERLAAENAALREQLGFVERRGFEPVAARILLRSATKQRSSFLIDKGARDGVREGMPAIAGNGVLVGKVVSVGPVTSTVTGIADAKSAVAVSLLNEGRTVGIAEGASGDLLSLRFVPHDQPLSISDLVVTSGLEERVPAGLLIGVVTAVKTDPNAPFQEAVVEPLVDARKEGIVTVLVGETPL